MAHSFLVIDDEKMVLNQVSRLLRTYFPQAQVKTALSGVIGLKVARQSVPDVIILDVSMPDWDGFETCRQIKATPPLCHVPVIMVTGVKTDSESRQRALECGADDYLFKPFNTDDLIFHIHVMLRIRKTDTELRRQHEAIESELRRRTEDLVVSERSFRELVQCLPDVVFEADDKLLVRYLNRAGMALFGVTSDPLTVELPLSDLIAFNARQAEAHIHLVLKGDIIPAYEYIAQKKNGERFVARISFSSVLDQGVITGLRGVLIDISAFKEIQHDLIESREWFRGLVSNMFNALAVFEMITEPDGTVKDARFREVNAAFERLLGMSGQDLIGRTLLTVMPKTESYWIRNLGQVALEGQTSEFEGYFGELGRYCQASAFRPKLGMVAAIFMDLTDRKMAEDQEKELKEKQQQARHLETITTLAGSVAHELNNILGPLLCYPDLILAELPNDAACREDVMVIKNSARRAISIVDDLAVMGRSGMIDRTPLDLNAVIATFAPGQGVRDLTPGFPLIRLSLELDPTVPLISGNADQWDRLLEILFCIGYDKVREHRVRVRTWVESLLQSVATPYGAIPPGDYVRVSVGLSGIVIPPEYLSRLFEPTLKVKLPGSTLSGLGLVRVFFAVKQHEGFIQVLSALETGTVFHIFIPNVLEKAKHLSRAEPVQQPQGSQELVLVVDDMVTQRSMAEKLLTALGYRVVAVENGREAVKKMEQGAWPDLELVLLDMIMEDDFDGLDTFRCIRKLRPDLKCLIASGYARNERVRAAEEIGVLGFVRKPYTQDRLASMVRWALDERPAVQTSRDA